MDIMDVTQNVVISSEMAMAFARESSNHRISCFEKAIPKLGRTSQKKFFESSIRNNCRERSIVLAKVFERRG